MLQAPAFSASLFSSSLVCWRTCICCSSSSTCLLGSLHPFQFSLPEHHEKVLHQYAQKENGTCEYHVGNGFPVHVCPFDAELPL